MVIINQLARPQSIISAPQINKQIISGEIISRDERSDEPWRIHDGAQGPRARMNLDDICFIMSGGNTLRLSPGVGGWVGRSVRRRPKSKIAFFRVLKHPLRSHTTKPFTEQRTPLPLRTYQGKRHRGRVSPRAGCLSILHRQFTYMQLYKHSQSPMARQPRTPSPGLAWPRLVCPTARRPA